MSRRLTEPQRRLLAAATGRQINHWHTALNGTSHSHYLPPRQDDPVIRFNTLSSLIAIGVLREVKKDWRHTTYEVADGWRGGSGKHGD